LIKIFQLLLALQIGDSAL